MRSSFTQFHDNLNESEKKNQSKTAVIRAHADCHIYITLVYEQKLITLFPSKFPKTCYLVLSDKGDTGFNVLDELRNSSLVEGLLVVGHGAHRVDLANTVGLDVGVSG